MNSNKERKVFTIGKHAFYDLHQSICEKPFAVCSQTQFTLKSSEKGAGKQSLEKKRTFCNFQFAFVYEFELVRVHLM